MLQSLYLLILLPYLLISVSSSQIDYQSESQALLTFNRSISQTTDFSALELEKAIDKNYWDLATRMILEYYNPRQIDIAPTFVKCKKRLKKENQPNFEKLTALLPLDSPSIQKLGPAFLWAQNMTFLFVKIKFSPRLDIPGVLEVQNMNITFNYDRFIFSALSFDQSDFPVHFYLEIEIYHHLNVPLCWWRYDSVGSVYLEMKKSPAPYFWRNIHIDQFKKLPNQYMWWDVYYNYMDDFNSYGANALLLFDQRELERETKEEWEEFLEKMKKRDAMLQKKRSAKIEEGLLQDLRNKMYCWYSYQEKKSKVLTAHDWEAWF